MGNLSTYSDVREMTAEELRWAKRLARVLAEAPDSLELATIGDGLMIWCRQRHEAHLAAGGDDCDGACDGRFLLAYIQHPTVHGISG